MKYLTIAQYKSIGPKLNANMIQYNILVDGYVVELMNTGMILDA